MQIVVRCYVFFLTKEKPCNFILTHERSQAIRSNLSYALTRWLPRISPFQCPVLRSFHKTVLQLIWLRDRRTQIRITPPDKSKRKTNKMWNAVTNIAFPTSSAGCLMTRLQITPDIVSTYVCLSAGYSPVCRKSRLLSSLP
jgi:hypothetical protein